MKLLPGLALALASKKAEAQRIPFDEADLTDPVTGVRFYLCHKDDPNRALLKNVRKNQGALTGLNMMPRHHASESAAVKLAGDAWIKGTKIGNGKLRFSMLRDSSAIHDEIVAAPEHYLCQFPAEDLECGTENEILPLDYKGTINYSRTGKKCVNWAKMSI